jgi:hypothetical protein
MKNPPPLTPAVSADAWDAVGLSWVCAALEASDRALETELRIEEALELKAELLELISEFWDEESDENNELSEDATADDTEAIEVVSSDSVLLCLSDGISDG